MINCAVGDLRQLVTIQTPVRTPNELGEQEITWSTLTQAWAQVLPLSGSEQMYAKQAQSHVTHKVRMRYFAGLTADCRIQWIDRAGSTRTLGISSLSDVQERGIEWEAQCAEQKPYGQFQS